MPAFTARLEKATKEKLHTVQEFFSLAGRALGFAFARPFYFQDFVQQMDEIGVKSLGIVLLTGFFTGMVLALQSSAQLQTFGLTMYIGRLVSASMIRELGPVLAGLMVAGRVGSGIAAQLGSMRVTEQIDAMEVSAINPFKYLVVTRVTAALIAIPILSFYCIVVGLLGSYVNVRAEEATSFIAYFHSAFSTITFLDLSTSIVKAVIYGFTIGIVGSYKGFFATKGTQGVGKAANQAVVMAMFLIFIEEVIIVQVSNWIRYF